MSNASSAVPVLRHASHFFIGGEWVTPSSDATFHVVDSCSEEVFLEVAEANASGHVTRSDRCPRCLRAWPVAIAVTRRTRRVPSGDRRWPPSAGL